MKKSLLIIAVAGLAFASCKKDYICECSASGGGVTITQDYTFHATKSDAKKSCDAVATNNYGSSVTCAIK